MRSPTEAEIKAKQVIVKELSTVKDTTVINFFNVMESMSLIKIFTEEGYNYVSEFIASDSTPHDILEFIHRIKTSFFNIDKIFTDIFNFISEDKMIRELLKEEYAFLDIKNVDELKKYYTLCVIYIYNNVIIGE